ncbi:MAG: hypothetical protein ACOC03_05170 [Desulfosalsimonas sp.]
MTKFLRITVGIMLILYGASILFNPIIHSDFYMMVLDFTDIKWLFGGVLIVVGSFSIWSSFRKKTIKAEQERNEEKKVLMCPQCVKPFYRRDCNDLKCPKCQATLEDLSGFYERHPELK